MIRINLLPVRQVQRQEAGRQYLAALVGLLVLTLGGNFYWYSLRQDALNVLEGKAAETEARISQLEKVIGEVSNLTKRKKEVEERLGVLERLRKQRGGPVKLLDALAQATPKKLWLGTFEEKEGSVKLSGNADSFEDVSEFMHGLNNLVWTPKGMGRVVELKPDGSSARVELLSEDNAIEDFARKEFAHFFTDIELKGSESASGGPGRSGSAVRFEISLSVNYTI
jgi:type IV pilus assembly protein PilN